MSAILPMRIGDLRFAVGASRLIEVISERGWRALAGAPRELPGVVTWRERAIAVVDIGFLLRRGPRLRKGDVRPRIVVLSVGQCTAALPVEEVHDVVLDDDVEDIETTIVDAALDALIPALAR